MPTLTRDEIVRLTPAERLALIGELWDSMSDCEMPVTAAQRLELERRLTSFDHDKSLGVSWEALHAELAARSR